MPADPILARPDATSESTPPDSEPATAESEAVRLFEQEIVKLRLKENWPAVQALKQLAAALGHQLDRLRIRRATVRERVRRNARNRAAHHRERAMARGLSEHFYGREWLALAEFYHYRCCYCGRDTVKLEIDHVVALSQGGSNRIENIQPLCSDCHAFFRTIGRQVDHRRYLPDWFELREKAGQGRRQNLSG